MLKVDNNSNVISTNEIVDCINTLLGSKYKKLDINIKIYKNKYSLCKDIILNRVKDLSLYDINKVFDGTFCGQYCVFTNHIKIYPFNRKHNQKHLLKLQIIYDILHEIRHLYQKNYCSKKFYKDIAKYIPIGDGYEKQWIEMDANRCAKIIMNKNKRVINNILNINDNTWFAS